MGALLTAALMAPAAALPVQAPVDLGACARYAVLAGSLVSNIPTSAVTGDIGLSPAAGSKITGFGMAEVTGSVFTVDETGPAGSTPAAADLTVAKGDLTLAYNDAAGRTPVPEGPFLNPGAGNIGGMTLVPGLYKSTSGLEISGSDLTLSGGADAVWIFQVASDLNVGNGIKIILAGGAKAENVFWQIGTSATLGTTSVFKGTILADQSISLNTGATLDGRALASSAAVTLAGNAVTRPAIATTLLKGKAAERLATLKSRSGRPGSLADIEFSLPAQGRATLRILNASGKTIAILFDGVVPAGEIQHAAFPIGKRAKGPLFSELQSQGSRLTRILMAE